MQKPEWLERLINEIDIFVVAILSLAGVAVLIYLIVLPMFFS
jgi:hypothetical protein